MNCAEVQTGLPTAVWNSQGQADKQSLLSSLWTVIEIAFENA